MKLLFRACLALAVLLYVAMMFWTFPAITQAANGERAFDLRPFGYGFGQAKSFLAALNAEGRAIYLGAQHWLDTAYPAILALTLVLGSALVAQKAAWTWLMAVLALLGAVFDYRENLLVARMLKTAPDALTPELVASASQATEIKSLLTSLAMVLLLWLGMMRVFRWNKSDAG